MSRQRRGAGRVHSGNEHEFASDVASLADPKPRASKVTGSHRIPVNARASSRDRQAGRAAIASVM